MCIWVSLDVDANELKPFIYNAFGENRVDLDVITQDDIIFHSGKSGVHSYLDPVQFFEPSNFDKIKESIDHDAYGLMNGRGIIARSTLIEFLREGIQNRNNTQLTIMCIWAHWM